MQLASFAIVAQTFSENPRESIRLSRESGFAGLQFDVFSSSFKLTELSETGRREFRRLLTTHDQQLASLRVDIGPKGFTASSDIDHILARLDIAMETAAALGTRLLCVDLGPIPGEAKDATNLDAAMIELGKHADRYGVIVAFRSELASFAALDRALKAAGCPWFGIDLDPIAILQDDWPIDEIFTHIGPQIRHIRGRDAQAANKRSKPTTIGQGNVNWSELFGNLEHAGYRGWITIDPLELPNRSAAAVAGLEYLKKIISHG